LTYSVDGIGAKHLTWQSGDLVHEHHLATPADLASMGLVTQAEYDALQMRLKNIIDCFHGFDPKPAPAEPQPHVWKIDDYALCPDGKVRRVTHAPFYCFHDLYECDIRDCTPVPEPPMPLLPKGVRFRKCFLTGKQLILIGEVQLSLESWIAAYEADKFNWKQEVINFLYALAEWRKLVGRDV
jgi:hypothetical protein